MSTTTVVPCGCCRVLVEPDRVYFDQELQAHVCDPCRRELKQAKAQLARSYSAPADGEPSMRISIIGVYHGPDAPDNQAQPPVREDPL